MRKRRDQFRTRVWGALHGAFTAMGLGLGLLTLTACSGSADRFRIAIIPRVSTDAEWLSLHVGITEEAERRHVQVFWRGPSNEMNLQGQIRLLEDAVHEGAYGIVVRPSAFVAENHVISTALQKHIPVVIVGAGIGLPQDPHLHYVLEDTYTEGELVARRLSKIIGTGEAAIIGLQPDLPGNRERDESLERAIDLLAPHIRVYKKVSEIKGVGSSEEMTRTMIREHPELRAIIALNEHAAANCAAAILASGAKGRILLITYNQSLDTFLLLRSGLIDSIVVQPLREMGARCIDEVMNDRLKRSNFEAPVHPVLVTSENIDTEIVQQELLMHRTPPW